MNNSEHIFILIPSELPRWWQFRRRLLLCRTRRHNLSKAATALDEIERYGSQVSIQKLPNLGSGRRYIIKVPNND